MIMSSDGVLFLVSFTGAISVWLGVVYWGIRKSMSGGLDFKNALRNVLKPGIAAADHISDNKIYVPERPGNIAYTSTDFATRPEFYSLPQNINNPDR